MMVKIFSPIYIHWRIIQVAYKKVSSSFSLLSFFYFVSRIAKVLLGGAKPQVRIIETKGADPELFEMAK